MELEQQVVSLELAKRLKELGVKQDSLFKWHSKVDEKGNLTYTEIVYYPTTQLDNDFSAYTVAELGKMLPMYIKEDGKQKHLEYGVITEDKRDQTNRIYYARIEDTGFDGLKNADTEADTRAKMLVYLKENNLI